MISESLFVLFLSYFFCTQLRDISLLFGMFFCFLSEKDECVILRTVASRFVKKKLIYLVNTISFSIPYILITIIFVFDFFLLGFVLDHVGFL